MTSSEAIIKALTESTAKLLGPQELTDIAFPLTTGLKGKNPRHTFSNNLYKEARRPDGLLTRVVGKDGKTKFKLNPKRRELKERGTTKPGAKGTAKGRKATAKKAAAPAAAAAFVGTDGKKRKAAKVEQLRTAYLKVYDDFSTGVTEVAAALGVSKSTASRVLGELRNLGLADATDVNDEAQGDHRRGAYQELSWQTIQTYDYVKRDEAERIFDVALGVTPATDADKSDEEVIAEVTGAVTDALLKPATPKAPKGLKRTLRLVQ